MIFLSYLLIHFVSIAQHSSATVKHISLNHLLLLISMDDVVGEEKDFLCVKPDIINRIMAKA